MARKYNLHPIKTIKDWRGEDWDAYEERKTKVGLTLNFGWMYGAPHLGSKTLILTNDLIEFLKTANYRETIEKLGISSSTAAKLRREFNLQKVLIRRDLNWIVQHQNEILYYSFPMLLEKLGLRKGLVKSYSYYLISEVGIKRKATRHHESHFAVEKIYYENKKEIAECRSPKTLQNMLNTDEYTARKFHELACAELNLTAMSEDFVKNLSDTWQWRYEHRDTILNPNMKIEQIAEQLNTTTDDIYNARKAIRRRLNIKETIGVVRNVDMDNWVSEHALELKSQTSNQLQQKYQLTESQIKYRRMMLKKIQQNKMINV